MGEKGLNTRKKRGKKRSYGEGWLGSEGKRKLIVTGPMLEPTKEKVEL